MFAMGVDAGSAPGPAVMEKKRGLAESGRVRRRARGQVEAWDLDVEGKGDDEINFFTSLLRRKLDMRPGVGLSKALSDRGEQTWSLVYILGLGVGVGVGG